MLDSVRLNQLLLFALLALASYVVYEKYYSTESVHSYEPFTKGYSLEQVVIKSTDESGRIVTTVESPLVIHYSDTETTVVNEPLIRLHETTGDWVFQSEKGEINQANTEIYFPEQVTLKLAGEAEETVDIKTSELTVDVVAKMGVTAQAVDVTRLGMLLKGLGATVNFKQQEIEILNDMYAEFEN